MPQPLQKVRTVVSIHAVRHAAATLLEVMDDLYLETTQTVSTDPPVRGALGKVLDQTEKLGSVESK